MRSWLYLFKYTIIDFLENSASYRKAVDTCLKFFGSPQLISETHLFIIIICPERILPVQS